MIDDGYTHPVVMDQALWTPVSPLQAPKPAAATAKPAGVYEIFRSAIIEGQIRPGERLQAKRFSRLFGVSETPVREALIRLHMESLVVATPNHGFCSKAFEVEELAQLYAVASTLLCNAISNSKNVFNGEGLAPLAKESGKAQGSIENQYHARALAHAVEHLLIRMAKLSGNNQVVRIIRDFTARTHLIRLIDLENDIEGTLPASMRRLTQALEARNSSLALEILQALFRRKLDLLPQIADAANRRMLDASLP